MNTNIEDYEGDIISVKTTLRERYLQDKFLSKFKKSRLVIISLEEINDNDITSIKVDKDKHNFTKYIQGLLTKNTINLK